MLIPKLLLPNYQLFGPGSNNRHKIQMKISQPAHEMSHHITLAHVTIIICVCTVCP